MKRSEMNAHQQQAFDFICEAMSDYIGGYENALEDFAEGEKEHDEAMAFLAQNHETLIGIIYDEVMSRADKGTEKHLRFAGKDFIVERIDRRLRKWGY